MKSNKVPSTGVSIDRSLFSLSLMSVVITEFSLVTKTKRFNKFHLMSLDLFFNFNYCIITAKMNKLNKFYVISYGYW